MSDLSIVIPVYNEVENIPLLCERLNEVLPKLGRSYEVIVVDDGSTDGSWEKMVECASKSRHMRLIRFRRNFGQTAAISAGFAESKGEIIVTLDADLQNDPADIPKLLEEIDKGVDVVSGWRTDRKDPLISRRLPSQFANSLISKFTGVALHDYGCTLKAYKREVIRNLRLYGEMHRFIPALASWVGGSLAEVPVSHQPRRFGTSKYGISRTLRVFLDLLTVKFLLRYSTHPIQIFGKLGLVFGAPGMIMLAVFLFAHIGYNLGATNLKWLVEMSKRPAWIIAPFMLILFCMQFISMGLLAEIQIRTYHESQSKPIYVIKERVEPST
jgi:glycosyltransferase involved in cell wall biosynthesis